MLHLCLIDLIKQDAITLLSVTYHIFGLWYGCSCNTGVCVTGIAAIQRVEMAIRVIYQELYTTIKHEALHKTKGFMRNTLERFISSGEI